MKFTLLIVIILFSLFIDEGLTRGGGRGGGGRGGGGGFRGGSRGGIRSRGGSSSSRGSSRYSGSGGGYTKALAAGFIIGGYSRYTLRFQNTRYYRASPPICYTTDRSVVDYIGSGKSGGYFVCPFTESQSEHATYCCGPANKQRCCTYWEDGGRMAGAIIGIVLAVLTLIIITVLIIKCCILPKRRANARNHDTSLGTYPTAKTTQPDEYTGHDPPSYWQVSKQPDNSQPPVYPVKPDSAPIGFE